MIKRNRMTKFPFELSIERVSAKEQTETLLCKAPLRVIAGRREVYDALWNDRSVVVKVFSGGIGGRGRYKREWRGLSKLASRGVSTPEPLFYGKTGDGRWAVVVEKIVDSLTVLEVFNGTDEKSKRIDLLMLVGGELAKQHEKGILQRDLHLGNFLLSPVRNSTKSAADSPGKKEEISNGAGDEKLFVLDPGQMQFFSRSVTKRRSIRQLALLVCYLPADDAGAIAKVCEEYFRARGWRFGKPDETLLQKQLTLHRKRGIRNGLKKCLRTSKRQLGIRTGKHLAVFDRGFCQSGTGILPVINIRRRAEKAVPPFDLMEQIDSLMDGGEILKRGNTCYVSRLTWNGRDVVAKRYNHKGLVHSVRHTIKRSRARRGWLHAHRLGMLGISTPKPLAYVEQRKGLLVWKSYLVTEYVKGQKLYDFLRDNERGEEERSKVIQQVKDLLDKLGKYRITHGDLKHTNILVTDDGLVLTDLDGMRVHRWNWTYKIKRAKDVENFANGGHRGQAILSDKEVS